MPKSPESNAALRPLTVTIAFWLWCGAAVLLILFGMLYLTMSADELRKAGGENADTLTVLVRGWGAISLAVGVAVAFLVRPVRDGDSRFRRTLAVLSVVFGVFQILASFFGLVPQLVFAISLLLFVAPLLVYRSSADEWFAS